MHIHRNITEKQLKDLKENFYYLIGNCKTVLEFVNYQSDDVDMKSSQEEEEFLKDKHDKLLSFYRNLLEIDVDY